MNPRMRAFSGLVTLFAVLNISWAAYIWSLWGTETAEIQQHVFLNHSDSKPSRFFPPLHTVSERFFLGWGCAGVGAGVGVGVWGVVGGWVGVSGWLAVAAAGDPLLAGVEVGVLGDVGVAGLAVEPALYMGVRCLYWLGKVEPAPAAAVVDSSGWRAACSMSRPEPPALAMEGIGRCFRYKSLHTGREPSCFTNLAAPRSWECKRRREPCSV